CAAEIRRESARARLDERARRHRVELRSEPHAEPGPERAEAPRLPDAAHAVRVREGEVVREIRVHDQAGGHAGGGGEERAGARAPIARSAAQAASTIATSRTMTAAFAPPTGATAQNGARKTWKRSSLSENRSRRIESLAQGKSRASPRAGRSAA